MHEDLKRILLWMGVAVILIGSFLAIMLMGSGSSSSVKLTGDIAKDEWIRGDANAKVTLVEYSDFQCPACRYWETEVKALVAEFGAHIRLVYRHFPLNTIHQNAQIAAQAAEAAGLQNKFWEMHDLLFENQPTWEPQTPTQLTQTFSDYASKIGINVDQFKKDLNSDQVVKLVNDDANGGTAMGIDSTPTFYLNGTKLNLSSNEQFRTLVRDAVQASS